MRDRLDSVMSKSLNVEDADSAWLETFYGGHDRH